MSPKSSKPAKTREYLLRDIPADVAAKLRVAASLHGTSLKDYLLKTLTQHVATLESSGVSLTLPKGK